MERLKASLVATLKRQKKTKAQIAASLGAVTRSENQKKKERARRQAERARKAVEKLPKRPRGKKKQQAAEAAKERFRKKRKAEGKTIAQIRAELAAIGRRLGAKLRDHMDRNSSEFRRFVKEAAELEYEYQQAVDAWFSPDAA